MISIIENDVVVGRLLDVSTVSEATDKYGPGDYVAGDYAIGSVRSGGVISYTPDMAALRARISNLITREQERRRFSGVVTVTLPAGAGGPYSIRADRDAQTLLASFQSQWTDGRVADSQKIGLEGALVTIPSEIVRMIALAVEAYVEGCKDASADLQALLGVTTDANVETLAFRDDASWPGLAISVNASDPTSWPVLPSSLSSWREAVDADRVSTATLAEANGAIIQSLQDTITQMQANITALQEALEV